MLFFVNLLVWANGYCQYKAVMSLITSAEVVICFWVCLFAITPKLINTSLCMLFCWYGLAKGRSDNIWNNPYHTMNSKKKKNKINPKFSTVPISVILDLGLR